MATKTNTTRIIELERRLDVVVKMIEILEGERRKWRDRVIALEEKT